MNTAAVQEATVDDYGDMETCFAHRHRLPMGILSVCENVPRSSTGKVVSSKWAKFKSL